MATRAKRIKKSAIYTDTPEMKASRQKYYAKEKRINAKQVTKKVLEKPKKKEERAQKSMKNNRII